MELTELAPTAQAPETLMDANWHPLDSLSSVELEEAAQILRREKQLGDTVRFVSITLHEPPKSAVFSYQPGKPSIRQAFVVMLDRATQAAYEAIVDITAQSIISFKQLPSGIQPSIMLDEFFEVVTWTQLGIHLKPCGILDVHDFFAPLHALLDAATQQGFIRAEHRNMLMTDSDPSALLERMESWRPVVVDKWLDRSQR